MMACPVCGGTASRPIAPGYVECTSLVEEHTVVWRPMMGNPAQMEPHDEVMSRVCATRYHVGGPISTALCACGTFAIGICPQPECGIPVCGDHSRLMDGQRLCLGHANSLEIEITRKARAAEEARKAAAPPPPTMEEIWQIESREGEPGQIYRRLRRGFGKPHEIFVADGIMRRREIARDHRSGGVEYDSEFSFAFDRELNHYKAIGARLDGGEIINTSRPIRIQVHARVEIQG